MLTRGDGMRGALIRGVEPDAEAKVTDLAGRDARRHDCRTSCPAASDIVLGGELARSLGVRVGDQVTVLAPRRAGHAGRRACRGSSRSPSSACSRSATTNTTARSRWSTSTTPPSSTALDGPTGVQLRLADMQRGARGRAPARVDARRRRARARLDAHQRSWFAAVQIEKRMMFIILTLIVAVAAFNLVSTLVMTRHRQAGRHRDPAHARREPALGHGDLHGAGRAVGHRRHARRRRARRCCVAYNIDAIVPASSSTCCTSASCPQNIYLISQHAERPAARRHRADRVFSLLLVVRRDALSELARQPRRAGGGPAL